VVKLLDAYPNHDEIQKIVTPTSKNVGQSPDTEVVLPIVVVEFLNQTPQPIGIGERDGTIRPFLISVLGDSAANAQDIAQEIYSALDEEDITLNDYNQGFPPDITPSGVGVIRVDGLNLSPVMIAGSPNVADRHRIEIFFNGTVYGIPVFS
jgi:hypothetical protein